MSRRKWNRQRVIEAIQARHQNGLSMTTVWRDDSSLYYGGWLYFGGWHKALLAAGIAPPPRKWTRQRVLEAVQAAHDSGVAADKLWKEDAQLNQAAIRYFGSAREAFVAAGLPVTVRKPWTKRRVVSALRSRYRRGLSLSSIWRDDPALYNAMLRRFETKTNALRTSGLTDPRRWSRRRVIEEIRTLHRLGQPLASHCVPNALACAAGRLFGSWHDAMLAAGFEPLRPKAKPRRRWTKQIVLKRIRARHAQGLSLNQSADVPLSCAGQRYFGSWTEALIAAGVPRKRRKKWTKEEILEGLRARNRQGEFEETTYIDDRTFFEAAVRLFGSWPTAIITAGILAPGQCCRRRKVWSKQRVIEAIQDRYVSGLPLTYEGDHRLYAAATQRFGSWKAALAAACVVRSGRNR